MHGEREQDWEPMNFRSGSDDDEPEINLIPLIDVLVLTLIFLLVTTRFFPGSASQRAPAAGVERRTNPIPTPCA